MSKLSIQSDQSSQTVVQFKDIQGIESLKNGVKISLKNGSEFVIKGTASDNDYHAVAHSIQADFLQNKPTGIYSCVENVNGSDVVNVWYDYEAFL